MNKKLIKKYKSAFDCWIRGGKILFKFTNDTKWKSKEDIDYKDTWYKNVHKIDDIWNKGVDELDAIIIDDDYVELRKAIAEGKSISYWDSETEDIVEIETKDPNYIFIYDVEKYKITEKYLKIGDWVIRENNEDMLFKNIKIGKIIKINEDHYEIKLPNSSLTIVYHKSQIKKWRPKPGEICWFWYPKLIDYPKLGILKRVDKKSVPGCTLYDAKIPGDPHNRWESFEHCEPFLGELPTIFEEENNNANI